MCMEVLYCGMIMTFELFMHLVQWVELVWLNWTRIKNSPTRLTSHGIRSGSGEKRQLAVD